MGLGDAKAELGLGEYLNEVNLKYYGFILIVTVIGAFLTYALLKFLTKWNHQQKRKSYPKDTVILHQFPTSNSQTPSLSTPCLKLETWLLTLGHKILIYYD